jgi:1,2-diacylglycerol 3-alpha-glucosyltransferase
MACSGLGRVRRGNESWARHTAQSLHGAGSRVTLFGGAPRLEPDPGLPYVHIPNLPREAPLLRRLLSWDRRYWLEQLSFATMLQAHLGRDPHDIVHVADPILALRMERWALRNGVRVVYKDGLRLGPPWIANFRFAQVLAPWYLEEGQRQGHDTTGWFVIPHSVDVERFRPVDDRAAIRRRLLPESVPADAFVVLGAGDFSPRSNKRLDWLMGEVARLPERRAAHLVLLGQSTAAERREFENLAASRLPGRVHLVPNVPPQEMPEWYRAADVFAHAALQEPFGIVFLEAMACGLPVVGHTFAVTEWIMGEGGIAVDMAASGELAAVLTRWAENPPARRAVGELARRRAETHFAPGEIVPLYQRMYDRILSS